jgi:iron complex outermembrane receptor protein
MLKIPSWPEKGSAAASVAAIAWLLLVPASASAQADSPADGDSAGVAQAARNADEAPSSEDASSASGLAEIIVTAQKRSSDLQTTPISISVLGSQELTNRGVKGLTDLMDGNVPSLRIAPFLSRTSALNVGIRGIVPFDANQIARDASVGVYLDGVYLGRSQGLGSVLFDIERIEILKGPQGTLFGRNAVGGAVNIVPRKPTGEFAARLTGGVSNYGGRKVEARVDLPRIGDLSVKLDAVYLKRGGTVDNTMEGERDFNAYERYGVHAGLLWSPSDDLSIQYDFDISQDNTTPFYIQLVKVNPAVAGTALAPLVQVQSDRAKRTDIGVPQQYSVGKSHGHMLHMSWRASDELELRSISSYRRLVQTQTDNGIGAHTIPFQPNATFARDSQASIRQKQLSQELQLLGTYDSFKFIAGLYYFHEQGDDDTFTPNTMRWNATGTVATRLPVPISTTPFPNNAATVDADSYAAFAQATWSPAERLHLTAGGRLTHDKKHGTLNLVNGAVPVIAGVVGAPSFRVSSTRFDPMIDISFDATEDIFLYGKWGTAYRAGGANSRSLTYRAYGPEKVSTFELGAKTELLDRHLRLNVAGYYTRYTDIQIDFSASNLLQSARSTLETVNAPGVGTIKGLEADVTIAPVDGLTLTSSYAYTEGNLPQAKNPFANNALTNVFIIFTPKHALTAAIDYELPTSVGLMRFHLDGNYGGGYHSSPSETVLTEQSLVANARLSMSEVKLGRGVNMEVALWAKNLFNEQYIRYIGTSTFRNLGNFGLFNEPRTGGIDLTLSF